MISLQEGLILYRAPLDIAHRPQTDEDGKNIGEQPAGYSRDRMKPLPDRATEGRVNPSGIPVLLFLGYSSGFSMIGTYVGKFGDCTDLQQQIEEQGLKTEFKKYFYGCASGVSGVKP